MTSVGQDVPAPRVIKFTNCRLPQGPSLLERDLWIDSASGKILHDQQAFYEHKIIPDHVIDLGGRILAPGFINVQLNGACGFDFSIPQPTKEQYDEGLRLVNRALAKTGVTSYLPTVTSQRPEVYAKVLPCLGPSGETRRAEDGAESLGAHVEGPFINPSRNGIHSPEMLRSARTIQDLIDCYGAENFPVLDAPSPKSIPIKMITAAPEVGNMLSFIPSIQEHNIIFSIGHSDATYEQAMDAFSAGANMITHLFNSMGPFYHRHPGIFGLLGQSEQQRRPFYGLIADGIHLHPTTIKIAFNAHPSGMILVTDAMMLSGMPDGVYDWTNNERIVKRGTLLKLESSGRIAGSSSTLIECINNFRRWSGVHTAEVIQAATETPARMLGLLGVKGSLNAGADADLVVLGEQAGEGGAMEILTIDQVWKFGTKIFDKATELQEPLKG